MGVVIDRITTTKKGRYALFCDGEFLFSVDEDTFVRFSLRKGRALDDDELAALRAESDNRRAGDKALDLLSMREHSESELRRKLTRKFDEETARHAVARVRELGLTDDAGFARRYAEELLDRKGYSLRAAREKLREKGIARELADEVLCAYDDDETDTIRSLIDKKYRTRLTKPDGRKSVFDALARKGFRSRDIRAVLRDCGAEIEEEF